MESNEPPKQAHERIVFVLLIAQGANITKGRFNDNPDHL